MENSGHFCGESQLIQSLTNSCACLLQGFMPPHFRRWMHRFMKKAHAGHGPCPAGASASASGQATGTEPNSGSNSGPQQDEGAPTDNAYDDYLRKMGANIAEFLDPFGGCMVLPFSAFFFFFFFLSFIITCRKFGFPYLGRAQQPQVQHYPFPSVRAVFSCVQAMVWLTVFAIFNLHTDVNTCNCSRGLY